VTAFSGPERSSKEASDAFFEDDHFVLYSSGEGGALEQLQRLFDRFVRQAETSVVHGNHPTRFEVDEGAGGVGGIGVYVAKLLGIVGSDGKQREFRRKTAANLAEAVKVGRVAGVIDGVLAAAQDIAAITAVRIFDNAGSPMTGGDVGDIEGAMTIGVPPLEFDNLFVAEIGDEVEEVMRNDERGRGSSLAAGLARDGAQRLAMQVIEVGVGDEDYIHGRQIAQVEAGAAKAFQDKKPACEVGIDDDVVLADLEKKAGVSDEGDAKFTVRDEFSLVGLAGERGHCRIPHEPGELAGTLAESRIL
jgi:hypothetical protein